MMPLHSTIEDIGEEIYDDLFTGIRDKIARVDELHRSPQDDCTYIFLVWAKEDKEDAVLAALQKNASPHTATVIQLVYGLYAICESML